VSGRMRVHVCRKPRRGNRNSITRRAPVAKGAPIEHTMQMLEPGGDHFPAGHGRQSATSLPPSRGRNEPPGHGCAVMGQEQPHTHKRVSTRVHAQRIKADRHSDRVGSTQQPTMQSKTGPDSELKRLGGPARQQRHKTKARTATATAPVTTQHHAVVKGRRFPHTTKVRCTQIDSQGRSLVPSREFAEEMGGGGERGAATHETPILRLPSVHLHSHTSLIHRKNNDRKVR
jgi:hypothetical protein